MASSRYLIQVSRVLLGVDLVRAWVGGARGVIKGRRFTALPFSVLRPSCFGEVCTTRLFSQSAEVSLEQGVSGVEDPDNDLIDLPDSLLSEEEEAREKDTDVLADEDDYKSLPEGIGKGFYVVQQYTSPKGKDTFDFQSLGLSPGDIDRLDLTANNVSLPVALMILDPQQFPSMSRARKVCRKGNILIHKGPLITDLDVPDAEPRFDLDKCIQGRVGDRVAVDDVICRQERIATGSSYNMMFPKPPFDLPVIYEDDHFALVNKPAGVVVYSHKGAGYGLMTVRAALPHALKAPSPGTRNVMRRPASIHRLDKPTSGILVIAKTKPAMQSLSQQFRERIVKKTYMAIVNGIPEEPPENGISASEAYAMGVDVDPNNDSKKWNLIDSPLEDQFAITVWRAVKYVPALHANDGYLTLVELKPKTGRYHQLRRHMTWVCGRPLVGDSTYDGGTEEAMKHRGKGLFLCSTRLTLEHPTYNTPSGRQEWNKLIESNKILGESGETQESNGILRYCTESDKVLVEAEIPLPSKFESLLKHENERYLKFSGEGTGEP